jgi:transposase
MSRPESITLSAQEGEAMIERLSVYAPSRTDCEILIQVLRLYFWLMLTVQEAKLSVRRLRRLLFGKPLKAPGLPEAERGLTASDEPIPGAAESSFGQEAGPISEGPGSKAAVGDSAAEATPKAKGGHRPGTGRLGADAYEGAERVECRHEELAVGQRCPVCGQGTLYELPPGSEIRIDGHALLSALRYELQKLRCSACGQIFTATLPDEAGAEKYSARARAVLAVSRYYLGLPFYRLQGYQAMLGVPVPDATQWDQIEKVGDCAYVVFAQMEKVAAQGELIFQDDTAVRILSLMKENLQMLAEAEAQGLSQPTARTGMHTTALAVKAGEHTIILYYSSRRHAGENLQGLLDKREAGLAKPLAMSDALASNAVTDEAAVIRCHCLAHGRRKFSDLTEVFPQECQVVLDVIGQVFDHDEQAHVNQMSPAARFAYHQAYSRPIMNELKRWLDKQVDDRLVEPNSALGKAIAYMQGHWETLTRFLSVVGAPLDNNLVERTLKLFIRQRNNSLFYKTESSAYIASVLTSLIATCIHAGVNVLDYLVALQEHRAAVFADPAAWLPWTYTTSRASP